MLYWLIGFHSLILILGAHYTYARVPAGFWVQDLLELSRNHYDRVGHFAQGFIPAIAVREILIRSSPVKSGPWLAFLTVATCLAVSACYEFLEWWVAIAAGVAADSFLATQGDVWDTQWDMFLALCGAIVAIATLSRVHDRALARMETR
jgi:putative membrane protein